MSPSRGPPPSPEATATSTSAEVQADIRSSSALASAKHNLAYLWDPKSNAVQAPTRRRTRALLRALRYIGIFVFWRVVRYAKFALVGAAVAAAGATALGGFASGIGFLVAPPTIAASLGMGLVWAVGSWGFRKLGVGRSVSAGAVREVRGSKEGIRMDGSWRDVQGPKAVPW